MKKPRLNVTIADLLWLSIVVLLVVLQFWWLPGNGGNTADSFSNRLEGSRGLYNTVSALANEGLLPPVRREGDRLVPEDPCTLLLIAPDRYPDDHEQEALKRFVHRGGSVVFVPNWNYPNFIQPEYHAKKLRFRISHDWNRYTSIGTPATTTTAATSEDQQAEADDGAPLTAEAETEPDAKDQPAEDEAEVADSTTTPVPPPNLEPVVTEITHNELMDGNVPWRTWSYVESAPPNAAELVIDDTGTSQVSAWREGQGTFVVCATPDPFANRSMLFESQAEFAVRLIEYANQHTNSASSSEIVFSEFLNGAGSYKGASVMISPLLRSGTLQLMLAAVLMAWAGFHRFGPPLRERAQYRRSLAQSAQAVGNLQFSANDGGTSVRQYLDWFTEEVRQRYGHTRLLEHPAQLARQVGLEEDQVKEALDDARLCANRPKVSQSETAAAIRRLATIHESMFRTG